MRSFKMIVTQQLINIIISCNYAIVKSSLILYNLEIKLIPDKL